MRSACYTDIDAGFFPENMHLGLQHSEAHTFAIVATGLVKAALNKVVRTVDLSALTSFAYLSMLFLLIVIVLGEF